MTILHGLMHKFIVYSTKSVFHCRTILTETNVTASESEMVAVPPIFFLSWRVTRFTDFRIITDIIFFTYVFYNPQDIDDASTEPKQSFVSLYIYY